MTRKFTNPGHLNFNLTIRQNSEVSNSSTYVEIPVDLKQTYGVGNLVPVKVIFDDDVVYKGSLAKMGGQGAFLLIRKDVREKLGKRPGDEINVVIKLDDQPRELSVSIDIMTVLKKHKLDQIFNGLAYSHRREYLQWIEGAKKTETRTRRIEKMISMLSQKDQSH